MNKKELQQKIRNSGLLNHIDIYFGDHICKMQGQPENIDLWMLATMVSYFANKGDSAFSLDMVNNVPIREIFPLRKEKEVDQINEMAEFADAVIEPLDQEELLKNDEVIGTATELKPLVQEGELFYLNRYYQYEKIVADFIKERAKEAKDISIMKKEINKIFPEDTIEGKTNWQKVAAMMALRSSFSVISGGPGTGKTTTVGRILTLLLEQDEQLIIKLVAPTGKAAERLSESIILFKKNERKKDEEERIPEEILKLIPEEAETIHRFIGINSFRPKYTKYSPTPIDLLVIDEASMVSLPLFAKTFEALPSNCHVILLGDKDQLMAVENGNVLKDITDTQTLNAFSAKFATCVADLTDNRISVPTSPAEAIIDDSAIQLEHSWRFSAKSGIGHVSKAVNEADENTSAEDLLGYFQRYDDIELKPIADEEGIKKYIADFCENNMTEYLKALENKGAEDILSTLAKFRLLCAVNEGPFGVNEINESIENTLFQKEKSELFYHGRPVLITVNDYRLELMNGDVGIIIKDGHGDLKACFPSDSGGFREFNPASLGEHKTAFTISIHKSQGSEFDHVYMILPSEKNNILTKELIYTGITRAKKKCTVLSSPEIFHHAAVDRIFRKSGLQEKLK